MIRIAHRCGTDKYPELTIAGAKHSFNSGAAYVEMDVRFTKDGCPVINHDDNTLFLFGIDQKVADLTLCEFLALRHQSDISFPSYSLEHFLISGVRDILFHVKEGGENLPKILELCSKYNCLSSVVFGLQSVADIRIVKAYDSSIEILAFMPQLENIEEFAHAGADYIRLWEGWLCDDAIARVKAAGKKLWIMAGCVDGYKVGYTASGNFKHWQELGADGVLVNELETQQLL